MPAGVTARVAATVLVARAVAGCAGDGPPPNQPGSAFDRLQRQIFNRNCLPAGCHNASSRSGNMDLSEGAAYDQLVGRVPDNAAAREAGLLRVAPFAPERSFILIKLTAPGPGEGSRMPLGAGPLSSADIELIRAWILDGAPRGEAGIPSATPTPTATPLPAASPTPSRPGG